MSQAKAIRRTAQLRIMLLDVMPHVWRRILVPDSISLPALHSVLICAMGWQGTHPHEFDFGPVRFGEPDEDWPVAELRREEGVTLNKAMGGRRYHFEHHYDFGDNWRHYVVVEDLFEPNKPLKNARCIGGRNACPPEDVGGPVGYAEFLAAISDLNHIEHDNYIGWHEGPFDPNAFEIDEVNEALGLIKV